MFGYRPMGTLSDPDRLLRIQTKRNRKSNVEIDKERKKEEKADAKIPRYSKKVLAAKGKPYLPNKPVIPTKPKKPVVATKRNGWPIHWAPGGSYQKVGPRQNITLGNFKAYVTNDEYFMADLPVVKQSWSSGKKFDEHSVYDIRKCKGDYNTEPAIAMVCGAYVASCLCGVSAENLKQQGIIGSIARYHLYYHTRRFMKHPDELNKYDLSDLKIPNRQFDVDSSGTDGDGNYFVFDGHKEQSPVDYQAVLAKTSNGLTDIGLQLMQESVESYVYCILGAQARTRWSIVKGGAKSLQTQSVFRKLVEDTIIQDDVTIMISNMRTAISDTHVKLDMAITPGIVLVPSSMIILKNPIAGFNNVLTVADESMKFGFNSGINVEDKKKRTHGSAHKTKPEKKKPEPNPILITENKKEEDKSDTLPSPSGGTTQTTTTSSALSDLSQLSTSDKENKPTVAERLINPAHHPEVSNEMYGLAFAMSAVVVLLYMLV